MKFRELRIAQGFRTGKEFADKIGFKVARIYKWECGASSPKLQDIPEVAKALRVSEKRVMDCFR